MLQIYLSNVIASPKNHIQDLVFVVLDENVAGHLNIVNN